MADESLPLSARRAEGTHPDPAATAAAAATETCTSAAATASAAAFLSARVARKKGKSEEENCRDPNDGLKHGWLPRRSRSRLSGLGIQKGFRPAASGA